MKYELIKEGLRYIDIDGLIAIVDRIMVYDNDKYKNTIYVVNNDNEVTYLDYKDFKNYFKRLV